MRASAIAPAHIAQGSRVTQRSHSSSRAVPSASAAVRSATISAWAVGSTPSRIRLRAVETTAPERVTTAPTGTSPAAAAARASSSARRMGSEKGRTMRSASAAPGAGEALLRVAVGHAHGRRLDLLGGGGHGGHGDVGGGRAHLDLLDLDVESGGLRLPGLVERDDSRVDEADDDQDGESKEKEEGAHRMYLEGGS